MDTLHKIILGSLIVLSCMDNSYAQAQNFIVEWSSHAPGLIHNQYQTKNYYSSGPSNELNRMVVQAGIPASFSQIENQSRVDSVYAYNSHHSYDHSSHDSHSSEPSNYEYGADFSEHQLRNDFIIQLNPVEKNIAVQLQYDRTTQNNQGWDETNQSAIQTTLMVKPGEWTEIHDRTALSKLDEVRTQSLHYQTNSSDSPNLWLKVTPLF